VDVALVGIVLFVMLMFTRRRLDEVEKRARTLGDRLDELQLRQQRDRAELERVHSRLAEVQMQAREAPLLGADANARNLPPIAAGSAADPLLRSAPDARADERSPLSAADEPGDPGPPTSAAAAVPSVTSSAPGAPLSAAGPRSAPADMHPVPPERAQDAAARIAAPPSSPRGPDPFDAALTFVRELLFGGNTVVRVGILILLIGVVLLLRWAAEHAILPIELRLVVAALLAIALIIVGFRQRLERSGFSRALQGGGVAGLYLVVFFAFRTYGLIPAPLAFALLVGIAVTSGALSVLQNSRSLIMIAQVFGFAAPLLASTGKGSHVALFSYYLVLNLAIAGIAWFRAWRALNVLGFAFTFGVASAWGVLSYEPRHFASTEPFLIAFFLLYVSIPLLYALRHPGSPRGWVDGSLVFGTPLAALGLQWSLVHDRPFAMAFTALGMAAVYLCLAYIMKQRAPERLAMLGEAFLPIGVGFATLAIPYGLDNHNLTGAAWALEGAGLYWVGVRQSRALSRAAGVVLQLLAGYALMLDPSRPQSGMPILNTWFLAGLLLALSSLFISYYANASRAQLSRRDGKVQVPLLTYGLLMLFAMGHGEIDSWRLDALDPGARIAWFGLLALGLELIAGRLAWHTARYPGFLLWLSMFGLLVYHHFELDVSPLARGGYFGWPICAVAMVLILRRFAPRVPLIERVAHPLALWLWTGWLISLGQHAIRAVALDSSYVAALSLAICVLVLLAVLALSRGASWPIGVHRKLYLSIAAGGIAAALMLGVFIANVDEGGSAATIPYLPVLNALDIAILLSFAALLAWLRMAPADFRKVVAGALALLAFVSWNGLLARTVHHYAGVAFDSPALWDSVALQVAFSLSWTLIALCVMIAAHRRGVRAAWWGGAGLLTLVVAKLFLLDLAELSAPAKIGTFLGVGLLLLIVGALAPVPPPVDRAPEGPA